MIIGEKCNLQITTPNDYSFIYELIEKFLETNLSVAFLKLPKYDEFVKTYFLHDSERYTILNKSDELIGTVNISTDGFIGCFVIPSYEGQGIASEATTLVMKNTKQKRLFATVHNDNKRSISFVTRLGFKPKATTFEKLL